MQSNNTPAVQESLRALYDESKWDPSNSNATYETFKSSLGKNSILLVVNNKLNRLKHIFQTLHNTEADYISVDADANTIIDIFTPQRFKRPHLIDFLNAIARGDDISVIEEHLSYALGLSQSFAASSSSPSLPPSPQPPLIAVAPPKRREVRVVVAQSSSPIAIANRISESTPQIPFDLEFVKDSIKKVWQTTDLPQLTRNTFRALRKAVLSTDNYDDETRSNLALVLLYQLGTIYYDDDPDDMKTVKDKNAHFVIIQSGDPTTALSNDSSHLLSWASKFIKNPNDKSNFVTFISTVEKWHLDDPDSVLAFVTDELQGPRLF